MIHNLTRVYSASQHHSQRLKSFENNVANKRKWLNLEEKVAVIDDDEKTKKSERQLSKQFEVGKTQIHNILRDKEAIMKSWRENGTSSHMKKKVKTVVGQIDSIMYDWFYAVRNKKIPVTGPVPQEKALIVARSLDCSQTEFKASND